MKNITDEFWKLFYCDIFDMQILKIIVQKLYFVNYMKKRRLQWLNKTSDPEHLEFQYCIVLHVWIDRWVNRWMNRWMDGWID